MSQIKSVTITITLKETNQQYQAAYTEYDKNGNEILSIDKDYSGQINSKIVSLYNQNNQRTKQLIYSQDDILEESRIFEYQENGNLAKETITYADMSSSTKTYTYENNKVVASTIDEEGAQEALETTVFNENNLPISFIAVDEDGNTTTNTATEYDENNRPQKIVEFDQDGNLTRIRKYAYNEIGKVSILSITNNKNEVIDSVRYHYDDKGREILRSIGLRSQVNTEYDDENHTITQTTSIAGGQILNSTITTFDQDGKTISEEDFNTKKEFNYELY